MLDDPQALYLIGCSIGHVTVGSAEDLRQAGRLVGLAYKRFLQAGLTQAQAAARIRALGDLYGTIE